MNHRLFRNPISELRYEILHALYDRVASLGIPGQIIRDKRLITDTICSERYIEPVSFTREGDGSIKFKAARNSEPDSVVLRIFFEGDPRIFEYYPEMLLKLPRVTLWGSNLLEVNLPPDLDEDRQDSMIRDYLNLIDYAVYEMNKEVDDINNCLPEAASLAIEMYNLSLGHQENLEEFSKEHLYF